MYRKDVNERSPLRVFERSIHGGLGRGNLGVVISRAGVGKSAFLIGVALDDLMRERRVLHVSIGDSVDHVRKFYDETFMGLVRTTGLLDADRVRLSIERHRHIHSYQPGTFRVDRLREVTRFLEEHAHFKPDTILIDNFPHAETTSDGVRVVKEIAGEMDSEVWLTALSHRDTPKGRAGYPDPVVAFDDLVSVKIFLQTESGAIRLRLLKDHESQDLRDISVELDPTSLLLKERAEA